MTHGKTSRRHFVRSVGGLALVLRHGLLPAQAAAAETRAGGPARRPAASLEDAQLRIEWDANLHTRILRRAGPHWVALTAWGPGEYLQRDDGRHIADFALANQAEHTVDDVNGPGARRIL